MKIKIFALLSPVLALLYPLLLFDPKDTYILEHDLFDYAGPIALIGVLSAIPAIFVVKGWLKLLPILAIIGIALTTYLGLGIYLPSGY